MDTRQLKKSWANFLKVVSPAIGTSLKRLLGYGLRQLEEAVMWLTLSVSWNPNLIRRKKQESEKRLNYSKLLLRDQSMSIVTYQGYVSWAIFIRLKLYLWESKPTFL